MKFQFGVTVPSPRIISAALGVNAAGKLTDKDLGKPVKLEAASADHNYIVCSDGDEIEGFVTSIEPHTVNDGFGFGGVQLDGRVEAQVVSGGTTLAVGDLVVAAAQAAVGTAQDYPQVKKGTAASQLTSGNYTYTERTPNTFIWRVISLLGDTGAAGKVVLIEKV